MAALAQQYHLITALKTARLTGAIKALHAQRQLVSLEGQLTEVQSSLAAERVYSAQRCEVMAWKLCIRLMLHRCPGPDCRPMTCMPCIEEAIDA